jgi:hypothetical protein
MPNVSAISKDVNPSSSAKIKTTRCGSLSFSKSCRRVRGGFALAHRVADERGLLRRVAAHVGVPARAVSPHSPHDAEGNREQPGANARATLELIEPSGRDQKHLAR